MKLRQAVKDRKTSHGDIYSRTDEQNSGRTHVHIFHEKPTFYFSPVDRHLCYGDFKTLGNVQELHIKSPKTGKTNVHSSCSTGELKFRAHCY